MEIAWIVAALIGGLLVGLGIGWALWARACNAAVAARDERFEQFRQAITDLAGAEERARKLPAIEEALASAQREREAAATRLASLEAERGARDKAFEERLTELREAKDALSAQFSEIGSKLLGEAQKNFLERADARFNQAGEKSEERLKQLLQPVGDRLRAYEEQVGKVEKERNEAYGSLTGLIEQMRAGQERVQTEAARLVNSLRNAPKARGRWGEQQLRNVLESCGLSEHADFTTETSVAGEEGRLRPDAVIRVPGGRALVIDAKVSLNDYQDAFNAEDDVGREAALARHCASMKAHIDGLSRKAYWDQFAESPDYVIMFVPGEHFLTAALEHDQTLWDHAFAKKVLLATPTNLIAIARTVAAVWRQEGLAREAQQIGMLGKEMYDRLAVAAQHLRTVGGGLATAVNNYNKFVGSFDRNVLATGRKFAELNIETGKREIEDVPLVEAIPREPNLSSLPVPEKEESEEPVE